MKTPTRTRLNSENKSKAYSQHLALESRLVFDGAIAATVVDAQADTADTLGKPVADNVSADSATTHHKLSLTLMFLSLNKRPPLLIINPSLMVQTINQRLILFRMYSVRQTYRLRLLSVSVANTQAH